MSLHHYTDANAIYSIIDKQKIWLTDLRFLNDKEEHKNGFDIFKDLLKSYEINKNFGSTSREWILDSLIDRRESLAPTFVFSLTSSDDLLSQWRSYGDYSIEFHKLKLQALIPELKACVYKLEQKKTEALSALKSALVVIDADSKKGPPSGDSIDELIRLSRIAAYYKDDGFSEEEEFRIVSQDKLIFPDSGGTGEATREFRVRGNVLIPYIALQVPLDCIKSIKIGPIRDQVLAYLSMKEFVGDKLIKFNELSNSDIEHYIDVTKSRIPYRGL